MYTIILTVLLLTASCKYFKNKEIKGRPVAKVGNYILYYDEIDPVAKSLAGKADSAEIMRQYVTDWVKRKLMIQKAQRYLPPEKLNVERQVNDYRESLILYAYEQELILQKTDTIISPEELKEYYEQYTLNFKLDKDIVQIHFVKTPIESPKLDSLAYWFSSKQEQHQVLLRDYCYQYATDFSFSDSTWYETDILSSSFPVSKDQLAAFYHSRTPAVLSDSAYFYVLKVNDYKSGGEVAPLDYVKTDITRILMNNRKMRLLRSTYETIYQEALLNKEFEIYP